MRRILLLAALAAPLALAGCGPDCSAFCSKLVDCPETGVTDRAKCIQGCNDVGGDRPAYIACVVDPNHTCADIATRCQLPSPQ